MNQSLRKFFVSAVAAIVMAFSVQAAELEFSPAPGEVENLSTIIVTNPQGIANCYQNNGELKNEAGEVVAMAVTDNYIPDDKLAEYENGTWNPTQAVVILKQNEVPFKPLTIATPGTYTLSFPENAFSLGEDDLGMINGSQAIELTYVVKGAAEDESSITLVSSNLPDGYSGQVVRDVELNFAEDLASAVYGEYYYDENSMQVYTSCNVILTDAEGKSSNPMDPQAPYLVNMNVNYRNAKQVQVRLMENFTGDALPNGSYTLTFKEGCITAKNGAKNKEFTINFTYRDNYLSTFTPESGSIVKEINEIRVENADGIYASGYFASLLDAEGVMVQDSIYAVSYVYDEIDGYVPVSPGDTRVPEYSIIRLNEKVTAPGTYNLEIPAGMFFYLASLESYPATTLTYTIPEPPAPLKLLSSTPGTDGAYPCVNEIRLKFDKEVASAVYGEYTEYDEDAMPIYTSCNVTLTDQDGRQNNAFNWKESPFNMDMYVYFFDPTIVVIRTLMPDGKAIPAGKYNVKVNAGAITAIDGSTNEEINFDFELRDYAPMVFTPENGSTVAALSQIVIDNPDGICHTGYAAYLMKDGNYTPYTLYGQSYVLQANGEYTPFDNAVENNPEIPTRVIMDFGAEITEPGTYTVEFCAGYIFYMSSRDDYPAFTYTFTIDPAGIEGIELDNIPAVFYNLQGVKVPGNNLAPGVYLKVQGSNASKVVIK